MNEIHISSGHYSYCYFICWLIVSLSWLTLKGLKHVKWKLVQVILIKLKLVLIISHKIDNGPMSWCHHREITSNLQSHQTKHIAKPKVFPVLNLLILKIWFMICLKYWHTDQCWCDDNDIVSLCMYNLHKRVNQIILDYYQLMPDNAAQSVQLSDRKIFKMNLHNINQYGSEYTHKWQFFVF